MTHAITFTTNTFAYDLDRCNTVSFTANSDGTKFFTVRLELRRVIEEEIMRLAQKIIICRHDIEKEKTEVFDVDFCFDETTGTLVDFYVLSDEVGVLVTFNSDSRCLTQYMVQMVPIRNLPRKMIMAGSLQSLFDMVRGAAFTICERRKTINGMQHSVSLGYGLLPSGVLLVTGSTASGIDRSLLQSVEAHLMAANPLLSDVYKDKDLSENVYQIAVLANKTGNRRVSPHSPFIDKNGIYFKLLELKDTLSPIISTKYLGVLYFGKQNKYETQLITLDNSVVENPSDLRTTWLLMSTHAGGSAYLSFLLPDREKLAQWSWWFRQKMFYVLVILLHSALRVCLFFSRFDGGFMMRSFLRIMMFIYGDDLVPHFAHPKKFYIYALSIQGRKFTRVPYEINGAIELGNTPIFDASPNGALLLSQLPCIDKPEMEDCRDLLEVQSLWDPCRPPPLAEIASRVAMKSIPDYTKSSKRTKCELPLYIH